MIKLYRNILGFKGQFLGCGTTLYDAVKDAYDNGLINAYDELSRNDYNEQIEVLTDYVFAASEDYLIERIKK